MKNFNETEVTENMVNQEEIQQGEFNEGVIKDIIDQRNVQQEKLKKMIEKIDGEIKKIETFKKHIDENQNDIYFSTLLEGKEYTLIKEYTNIKKFVDSTIKGFVDSTEINELLKEYNNTKNEYEKLFGRYDRKTVNIGIFGSTGAGKSTLMKIISGVFGGEYDKCIPTNDKKSCTGALIILEHDDTVAAGKIKASVKFKSLNMVKNEIKLSIEKLYLDAKLDEIKDANMLPVIAELQKYVKTLEETDEVKLKSNLRAIQQLTFPEAKLIKTDKANDVNRRDRFTEVYQKNFDEWFDIIEEHENKTIDTEDAQEIAEYVTFNAQDGQTYHKFPAVESVVMKAKLKIGAIKGLRFTDTQGLDDNSNTEIPKRIRDEFDKNIDAAIIMINGRHRGDSISGEFDAINECIDPKYVKERDIGAWMMVIVNHMQGASDVGKERRKYFAKDCQEIYNALTYEGAEKELDEDKDIANVKIADVTNKYEINKKLKDFLATIDIARVDKKLTENVEKLYKAAKKKYDKFIRDLSEDYLNINKDENSQFAQDRIDGIKRRLIALSREEDAQKEEIWKVEVHTDNLLQNIESWIDNIKIDSNLLNPDNIDKSMILEINHELYLQMRKFGHETQQELRKRENTFKILLLKCILDELNFDETKFDELGLDKTLLEPMDRDKINSDKITINEKVFDKLLNKILKYDKNSNKNVITHVFRSADEFKLTDMTVITKKLFDKFAYDFRNDFNLTNEHPESSDNNERLSQMQENIKNDLKEKFRLQAERFSENLKLSAINIDEHIPNVNDQILCEIYNFEICFFMNQTSLWTSIINGLLEEDYISPREDDETAKKIEAKNKFYNVIEEVIAI